MPPNYPSDRATILGRFRWTLGLFILALVLSGITAFPLQREIEQIAAIRSIEHVAPMDAETSFDRWILTVRDGLRESYPVFRNWR